LGAKAKGDARIDPLHTRAAERGSLSKQSVDGARFGNRESMDSRGNAA